MMYIDANLIQRDLQTEFDNTVRRLHIAIELVFYPGCKFGSKHGNQ